MLYALQQTPALWQFITSIERAVVMPIRSSLQVELQSHLPFLLCRLLLDSTTLGHFAT